MPHMTSLGINSHRILVTGERISPTPAEDQNNAGQDPVIPRFPWWAVWITAGFVISGVYVWRTGYQTVPVAKGKTEETADDESDSGVTAAEKE